jgi:hypothetical protein
MLRLLVVFAPVTVLAGCGSSGSNSSGAGAVSTVFVTTQATTTPADSVPDTLVSDDTISYVEQNVTQSWNKCGSDDVCIPGTTAREVTCSQPSPSEMRLECFVATARNLQHGYGVDVTVQDDGSFSWGLSH